MTIKYRIGIMPGPWPAGKDGGEFLFTLGDFCEKSDVDSIWLSDRLSSPTPVPEVMTSLAAIAARTQKLKFGPSVLVLPYRTPVVAAKEMATIDWLSRGRLFPAVGVGVELPREFDASGVPFKERGRRTDETIKILRLLWTQDEVSYQGEFFKLDRVTIFPKPCKSPPRWRSARCPRITSAPSSTTPSRRVRPTRWPWRSPISPAAAWTRRPCAPPRPSARSRCSPHASRNTRKA